MLDRQNNSTFPDILQKGLGRAFEYIKQHNGDRDRKQIRKDLLNACIYIKCLYI